MIRSTLMCTLVYALVMLTSCENRDNLPTNRAAASGATHVQTDNRRLVRDAIDAELPKAKAHLKGAAVADRLDRLLARTEVLGIANVLVEKTLQDGLFSSQGWGDGDQRTAVAISAISSDAKTSTDALRDDLPDGFDGLVKHYDVQVASQNKQSGSDIDSIIFLVLVVSPDKSVVAAIGSSEVGGQVRAPRQLVGQVASQPVAQRVKPGRCDIGQGEIIQPGEGYLITSQDVAASEEYWRSLDPATTAIMKRQVETDTSPWLVCEHHIAWFKVDKDAARQAAVEHWKALFSKSPSRKFMKGYKVF
ncbi:MAG: hypothetical protein ACREQ3_22390 [Candidatus Binatia bacterium]